VIKIKQITDLSTETASSWNEDQRSCCELIILHTLNEPDLALL